MAGPAPLNIDLLDRLRSAPGASLPLASLGPDPEAVRADLEALISFGFAIDWDPDRGASYVGPADRLCPDQIEHGLSTSRVGRRIAVWSRVTSTNDVAARAVGSPSNDGLVVLAEEQTAGRGRLGRSWAAPPRSSILISVVLFPPAALASGFEWLTALGAVAAAEVISVRIRREASIKWPNDVRVDGRKIAGVLVERPAPGRAAIIGIGLNVNLARDHFPDEVKARATSILIERGGRPADRSELARELIRRLDHWYTATIEHGPGPLGRAWRDRNERLGQAVRVETSSGSCSGRLIDLDLRFGLALDVGPEGRDDPTTDPSGIVRIRLADVLGIAPAGESDGVDGPPWTSSAPGR